MQSFSLSGVPCGYFWAWARGINTGKEQGQHIATQGPTLRKALPSEGPKLGFMLCNHHLKIRNHFEPGPCQLCSWFRPGAPGSGRLNFAFQFPNHNSRHLVPGLFYFPIRNIFPSSPCYMGYWQKWEMGCCFVKTCIGHLQCFPLRLKSAPH